MAGNDTAALVVALSAQLTKFEKDMDNAVGIADRGARNIESRFNKINPHANIEGFIGDLQKIAAAGGLAEVIKSVAALNEQVAKLGEKAEVVGLTTDEFQKFRFAVVATGGSIESADSFLVKFSNNLAQAAKGQGDLYNFLRVNNVALRDSNGQMLPANTLLARYADLVKNTRSPQEQLNEAIMVGGRQAGPELVSALRSGSDGLREFGIEAEHAGVIIDGALIDRAKRANEQFQVLKLRATTVFEEAAVAVVETFQRKNAEMDKIGQGWADSLKNAWKSALDYINSNNPDVKRIIKNLNEAITNKEITGAPLTGRRGSDILSPLTSGSDNRFTPAPVTSTGTGTTKQYNAQADAFEKLMKAQEGRILLLNAERDSIGLTVGAATAMTEKIKLETQLKQENIPITAARQAKIDEEAKKLGAAAQALDDYKRKWVSVNSTLQFIGDEGISAIDGLRNGTLSAADAVKQLENAFIHAAEQALLLGSGPLAGLFGTQSNIPGGTGGILGMFTGLFGGSSSSSSIVAPTKGLEGLASGTDNWRGGSVVVGENGPEIVNLPRGSQVIPNNVISGGGGAPQLNLKIINNAGAKVSQGPVKSDGNGGISLEVMIDEAVARSVSKPGSQGSRAMRQTYGLNQRMPVR